MDESLLVIHNAIKEAPTSAVGEYSNQGPGGFWRQASSHQSNTTTRYGPKPKPLAQRVFKLRAGPVKKVKRSYSKDKKVELLIMIHHQVICHITEEYRPQNQVEASVHFKIPQCTISYWYRNQDKNEDIRRGHYHMSYLRSLWKT